MKLHQVPLFNWLHRRGPEPAARGYAAVGRLIDRPLTADAAATTPPAPDGAKLFQRLYEAMAKAVLHGEDGLYVIRLEVEDLVLVGKNPADGSLAKDDPDLWREIRLFVSWLQEDRRFTINYEITSFCAVSLSLLRCEPETAIGFYLRGRSLQNQIVVQFEPFALPGEGT